MRKRLKKKQIIIEVMQADQVVASCRQPLRRRKITIGKSKKATLSIPFYPMPSVTPLFNLSRNKVSIILRSDFEGSLSIHENFQSIKRVLYPKSDGESLFTRGMPAIESEIALKTTDRGFFNYKDLTILFKFTDIPHERYFPDRNPVLLHKRLQEVVFEKHLFTWVTFFSLAMAIVLSTTTFAFIAQQIKNRPENISETSSVVIDNLIHPDHYSVIAEATKNKLNRNNYKKTIINYQQAVVDNEFQISAPFPLTPGKFLDKKRRKIRTRFRREKQHNLESVLAQFNRNKKGSQPTRTRSIYIPVNKRQIVSDKFAYLDNYFDRHYRAFQLNYRDKIVADKSFERSQEKSAHNDALEAFSKAVGGERGTVMTLEHRKVMRTALKRRIHTPLSLQEITALRQDNNRNIQREWQRTQLYLDPDVLAIVTDLSKSDHANPQNPFELDHYYKNYRKNKKIATQKKLQKKRIAERAIKNPFPSTKNPIYINKFLYRQLAELKRCLKNGRKRRSDTIISFIIDKRGRGVELNIERSRFGDRTIDRCFVKKIAAWRFPTKTGKPVYVSFPIIF